MARLSSPRVVPLVLAVLLTLVVGPAWGLAPELPRVVVDTTLPTGTSPRFAVSTGPDFQDALNRALPGDVIALQAGARFAGPFTLPNKTVLRRITLKKSE